MYARNHITKMSYGTRNENINENRNIKTVRIIFANDIEDEIDISDDPTIGEVLSGIFSYNTNIKNILDIISSCINPLFSCMTDNCIYVVDRKKIAYMHVYGGNNYKQSFLIGKDVQLTHRFSECVNEQMSYFPPNLEFSIYILNCFKPELICFELEYLLHDWQKIKNNYITNVDNIMIMHKSYIDVSSNKLLENTSKDTSGDIIKEISEKIPENSDKDIIMSIDDKNHSVTEIKNINEITNTTEMANIMTNTSEISNTTTMINTTTMTNHNDEKFQNIVKRYHRSIYNSDRESINKYHTDNIILTSDQDILTEYFNLVDEFEYINK